MNKRTITIFGVTGHFDKASHSKCRQSGMDRVLTEPINF